MDDTEANALAYENRLILDELILRQDSIESARAEAFDKRFASLVGVLKDEIKKGMQSPEALGAAKYTAVASNDSRKTSVITKDTTLDVVALKNRVTKTLAQANTAAASAATTTPMQSLANTSAEVANTTETYTRTLEFAPVNKVLNNIIAKPAITSNDTAEALKDGVMLPIKTMKQSDLVGVKSGFYVIANVFKSKKYLDAFMGDLKQKGLDAGYFYNKENGLHYVYLADYNYKSEAKTAYVSNMNGQYNDEKWIMQVDNATSIVDNFYEDQ